MTQTCMQCGATNGAEARACRVCDARLPNDTGAFAPVPASAASGGTRTEGNLAIAEDWRVEVAKRLEAYRARRRRLGVDPAQPEFPFEEPTAAASEEEPPAPSVSVATLLARPAAAPLTNEAVKTAAPRKRPARVERLEIDMAQPALDFGSADAKAAAARAAALGENEPLIAVGGPIAGLGRRLRAAAFDTALLAFSFGAFLALFIAVGGHLQASKLDEAVILATAGLFYAQYFGLFTFLGGSTPGMMLCRLRVAGFDGTLPTPRQLVWRSFGYMVSAGTVMLGFLWALWDDDHLTWHDRISQTYLTATDSPLEQPERSEPPGLHRHLGKVDARV